MGTPMSRIVLTGTRIMIARQMLGWLDTDLARQAGVRTVTVRRAESVVGEPPITVAQRQKLQRALEVAGIEFTEGDVRLRSPA